MTAEFFAFLALWRAQAPSASAGRVSLVRDNYFVCGVGVYNPLADVLRRRDEKEACINNVPSKHVGMDSW